MWNNPEPGARRLALWINRAPQSGPFRKHNALGACLKVGGLMEQTLLNIGFGSSVVADRVVAIVSPNSAPMKRLKDEAKEERRLIDATHGRRTRSMIVMDSNHIVLSAIQAETVSQRYAMLKELT